MIRCIGFRRKLKRQNLPLNLKGGLIMNREQLIEETKQYIDVCDDIDVLEKDCEIIKFILDNCQIIIPEENRFGVRTTGDGIISYFIGERAKAFHKQLDECGLRDGLDDLAYTGSFDFGHTSPEWETVANLGFWGLRKRVEDYFQKAEKDYKKQRFYSNLLEIYDAIFKFMNRAAEEARRCGKDEMAQGFVNLTRREPKNLFEVMQTIVMYYLFQHTIEGTYLRTLGRLDRLFYPFYVKENKENSDSLLMDFFREIDTLELTVNVPFAIGGSDASGNSLINEVSYSILEKYDEAGTSNTKFHILCTPDMPEDIVKKAFECIRRGNNSIVLMNDAKIIRALSESGADYDDAVNYHIVGCYEPGANNEIACTCNGRVNLPKALELALNKGRDMLTGKLIGLETDSNFADFEELYSEFERQLGYLCDCAIKATNIYEANYTKLHSAPIFSSTYTSALEKGGDVYCDNAAKYCNSSVNGIGLATTTDSLAAIRKLVFEDKSLKISEFADILKKNWNGNETLRLLVKNKFPKYGAGDKKTDAIANDIVNSMANFIHNRPNVKGGKYRLGLFSISWRWEFGEKTAASADGRLSKEPLSQNATATFGADKNGATAHLLSAASFDYAKVLNGTVIDIDLHISAAKGENGINALVSSLKTFFELGGLAVQYNIMDTEILKDAKLHPQKYPNLQVRLCGWNVLFSALSEKEKDEFIARSQK